MTLILTIMAVILTLLLSGCASKEMTPQQNAALTLMKESIQQQTEVQTAAIAKDDCSFEMLAMEGQEIRNLASINFACNNSDKSNLSGEYRYMMEGFTQLMTYSPQAEIARHGFKALTTLGLAGFGAWTVMNNQNNWSNAVRSSHKNGTIVVEAIARNSLNTTTTTTDTVTDTFTTDTVTNTDTFGEGNTWNYNSSNTGRDDWFRSPEFNLPDPGIVPGPVTIQ